MVKIQYDGIRLATIYTGMRFEIVSDMFENFRRFCAPPLQNVFVVDCFMPLVPVMLDLFEAWAALDLQTIRTRSIVAKLAQRFELLTAGTLFHGRLSSFRHTTSTIAL